MITPHILRTLRRVCADAPWTNCPAPHGRSGQANWFRDGGWTALQIEDCFFVSSAIANRPIATDPESDEVENQDRWRPLSLGDNFKTARFSKEIKLWGFIGNLETGPEWPGWIAASSASHQPLASLLTRFEPPPQALQIDWRKQLNIFSQRPSPLTFFISPNGLLCPIVKSDSPTQTTCEPSEFLRDLSSQHFSQFFPWPWEIGLPASNWGTASDSLSENWHPANQSGLPLSRELSPPDLRLPTGGRALQTEWIKHPVVSRLPVGLVLASSACIGLLLLFLRLQPDSNPAKQRASSHLATPQLASAEIQTTSEPEPAPTSNRRPNPRHESPGGSNAAVHRPAMEMLPEELPGPPPLPAEFTAGEDPPMQMPESAEEASTEEASAEGDSTEEASEGQGRDDQDRDDQVSDDETVQGETAQDEMEVQGEVARGFRIENPVTRASVPIGENIQISKAVCHAILAFDDEASDPTADPNAGPTAGPNSGGRSYLLHPEAEQRIVGKGRQVWTLTHWEEEVELLLGLESNPSRKWGIVLRVGARLGPGEPLVLASPPIAQEKLTNLAQFSTTVEHRLRQLDAMRDGLIPRGKVNLTESRRQFNAQAKELETALERWRAVSELCEIAFAKLEFKLRFREE